MLPVIDQAHGGHNATHIYDADTSDADGQTRASLQGRARMLRMFRFLRSSIPGCERAVLKTMFSHALSRESYRIAGEYMITKADFMQATDFEDKVCNAFNYVDMHSREKGCEEIFHESRHLVPTVPFRALIPKGSSRITVAGRIVSADRVALAGIRAQCTCMAMGQAMGAAAALAAGHCTHSSQHRGHRQPRPPRPIHPHGCPAPAAATPRATSSYARVSKYERYQCTKPITRPLRRY